MVNTSAAALLERVATNIRAVIWLVGCDGERGGRVEAVSRGLLLAIAVFFRLHRFWTGVFANRFVHPCMSIAEEFSVGLQSRDVVEYGFHAGGDGDGEEQADGSPERAPEHQRNCDGERIEVDTRSDEFRIEEIEGEQVEEADDEGDD